MYNLLIISQLSLLALTLALTFALESANQSIIFPAYVVIRIFSLRHLPLDFLLGIEMNIQINVKLLWFNLCD